MKATQAIEIEIFNKLFAAVAEEMGIVLRRSAFSPNIRERCDFSCAVFDAQGEMVAQASHIPVHLGAMPLTLQTVLPKFEWQPGDVVITNDPFSGGTHLPDVTLIKPVFFEKELVFFLINRAHHADIGGKYAGSMAVATHIDEEGVRIIPRYLFRRGKLNEEFFNDLLERLRSPLERKGDFTAQMASLWRGERRLKEMYKRYGVKKLREMATALKEYAVRAMATLIKNIPKGEFSFTDYLDDDGLGTKDIPICVKLKVKEHEIEIDLTQSADQVKGSVNAPKAVTQAAVYYVFLCLLHTLGEYPINQGCFWPLKIITKPGTVVDAVYPAAVAAGNVETSQRIVDALLGALSKALPEVIPAASCGSMNNIAIGGDDFAYYETIGGGMGARPFSDGLSGIHTHMTNTLNTPIEALEHDYPLFIETYRLRKGSGGRGLYKGGDGLIRQYRFLSKATVTILSERRRYAPYGLKGGESAKKGQNWLIQKGEKTALPGKVNLEVGPGDQVIIETPGGGGWGKIEN